MKRRTVMAGLGLGAVTAAAAMAWRNREAIYDVLPGAHTSRDSRWYPFTAALATRLGDLSPQGWRGRSATDINNCHLLDLTDIDSPDQLVLKESQTVFRHSETWETSNENPNATGPDAEIGYPTLVSGSDEGHGPYHLFYAIHDARSGIGLAVAPAPKGPYKKIGPLLGRPDSQILRAPYMPRGTSHFSSPVVIWNAQRAIWHLYFHYYDNLFVQGRGHQHTALATSTDLLNWTIMQGSDGKYLSVLPTTRERWMNSQSSYHAILRLPNGLWLAWLRGTGGVLRKGVFEEDVTDLGLAVSDDGVQWALVPGSPQLRPGHAPVTGKGVIRPAFMALLRSGLHCCWSESDPIDQSRRYVMAATKDFRSYSLTGNPVASVPVGDGAVSVWRDEQNVFMFTGNRLHRLQIYSN